MKGKAMNGQMPSIRYCEEKGCGFNNKTKCHAFAITVGGPNDIRPNCDTFFETRSQCGKEGVLAGVGACKVLTCKFNEELLCRAPNINVQVYNGQAECGTFKSIGFFPD
jgi:Domain of Unknown Function (DUF1540)